MNYFAHGMRFTNRPYFLAGTAVPDWLSIADRRVRMRARRVAPHADGSATPQADLAGGVMQHLEDDRWFHQTEAFYSISGRLTGRFQDVLGRDTGFRTGFLGHVVTELVLDGVLIDANPKLIDAYYEALDSVDPHAVEDGVNRMARDKTSNLAILIPLFQREQFLRDYLQPERLLFRLNQVMRRIKLNPLPEDVADVLVYAWEIVKPKTGDLLPGHLFV